MPVTNGTVAAPEHRESKAREEYKDALSLLEKHYTERDGLDIRGLLDTSKTGALTYNDFLVLPGFIGMSCPPPHSRNGD